MLCRFVKDNYGENQIQALAGMGLIDSRSPTAKVTRGEALIAVMVITGMDVYVDDYSPEDFPCPYTDVSADLLPFVAVAYAYQIIEDMPYNLLRENDNVTLEEMLHMGQLKDEIKQEIKSIVSEMKLVAEDIKGAMVDKSV